MPQRHRGDSSQKTQDFCLFPQLYLGLLAIHHLRGWWDSYWHPVLLGALGCREQGVSRSLLQAKACPYYEELLAHG